MFKHFLIGAAALAFASASEADTSRVGNWALTSNAEGCTISTTSAGVRLMVRPENGAVAVTVANAAWRSIRGGEDLEVTVALDRRAPEAVGAVGVRPGRGLPPAVFFMIEPDFLPALAASRTLRLSKGGAEFVAFDLNGSGRAASALRGCLSKMAGDPFAQGG